jgi:hypothetical protein
MYSNTSSEATGLVGISRTPAIVSLVRDLQKVLLAVANGLSGVVRIPQS